MELYLTFTIIAVFVLFITAELWTRLIVKLFSKNTNTKIVFRDHLVNVAPAHFKVILFSESKMECALLIHGPFNGVATRTLLVKKGDREKGYQLGKVDCKKYVLLSEIYADATEEAKNLVKKIYGKRPKILEPEVVKPEVVKPEVVKPEVKGFKVQYVGKIAQAGMEKHVTTRNGKPEEYETFTLTLNTDDGIERLTGNDLRRAIADAGVMNGDNIRAIYLKDIELPNGFKKKSFQIVKLS